MLAMARPHAMQGQAVTTSVSPPSRRRELLRATLHYSHAHFDRAIRSAVCSFGCIGPCFRCASLALLKAQRRPEATLTSVPHDRIGRPKKWMRVCVECFARFVLAFRALQHGHHRLAQQFGPAKL